MKGILYSICLGSLALALTAQGQQMQGGANVDVKAKARSTARTHATTSTKANASVTSSRTHPNAQANVNTRATVNRNNTRMEPARTHRSSERNAQNTTVKDRTRLSESAKTRNTAAVNRERKVTGRNVTINQNRNVMVNRNRVSFAEAVTLHRHEFHNSDWWRRHFTVVIINNNAFFFDAGFWFPAWGYFPGAYYPYAGPIYAYDGLAPDQVVVNVQLQLQRDGYYAGPIDGVLGPMTQRALAVFQADHGLRITSAVDQATVATLGLG